MCNELLKLTKFSLKYNNQITPGLQGFAKIVFQLHR